MMGLSGRIRSHARMHQAWGDKASAFGQFNQRCTVSYVELCLMNGGVVASRSRRTSSKLLDWRFLCEKLAFNAPLNVFPPSRGITLICAPPVSLSAVSPLAVSMLTS